MYFVVSIRVLKLTYTKVLLVSPFAVESIVFVKLGFVFFPLHEVHSSFDRAKLLIRGVYDILLLLRLPPYLMYDVVPKSLQEGYFTFGSAGPTPFILEGYEIACIVVGCGVPWECDLVAIIIG